MSFLNTDFSRTPDRIELFLAKPDRTIVAKLNEAYGKNLKLKLGGINELSFKIPYEIDINHSFVKNPNIRNLRERYLLKVKVGNTYEWYTINKISDSMDESGDTKTVQAFSLAYELRDRIIRNYKNMPTENETNTTPKNILDTLQEVLSLTETNWTIDTLGGVDSSLSILYRSFEVSSQTVLNFIMEVAEKVKGLIVWDTENRKIYIKDAGKNLINIGINRGLRLTYGHYLRTLSRESNADEMVTRLKVFAKDGVYLNEYNPTGTNYLEDFSYFLYPFQRDNNRNVISSSFYMSDSLCHAILDYSELVESTKDEFATLTSQKLQYQTELMNLEQDPTTGLSKLETDLEMIQDNIDTINATRIPYGNATTYTKGALVWYNEVGYMSKGITTGNPPTSSAFWDKLVDLRDAKMIEAQAKRDDIHFKTEDISDITQQIVDLQNTLSVEINFTLEQIKERNDYIIEKEWTDSTYTNSKDLYDEALKKFDELKKPQVVFDIDIVDFRQIVECQDDWYKLVLGDTITIYYEKIDELVEAKIIEVETDEDNASVKLTIANVKDIETDEEKFVKMLYGSVSTSTTVDMSKLKWDGVSNANNKIDELLNNTWDANKRQIMAGINESVSISPRGIIIQDPNDPLKYVVMQHGIIAITSDGGNTWKHAITADGIVGERIVGRILAGQDLTIDATDNSGVKIFTVNSTGVTISGMSLTINGGLPPSQLDPSYKDGLLNLGTQYNGVVIDATNGVVITRSDIKTRTVLNATSGISVEQNTGTTSSPTWKKKFYVGTDGKVVAEDMTTKNLLVQTGDVTPITLIDASTKTIDFSKFNTILGKDQVLVGVDVKDDTGASVFKVDSVTKALTISGNINMKGGSISWSNVNVPSASQIGAVADNQTAVFNALTNNGAARGLFWNNNQLYINADYINGGTITGLTIRTASAGTRVELKSNYADINLYNTTGNFFRIEDSVSAGANLYSPNGQASYLGGTWYASGVLYVTGTLNLSSATIIGGTSVATFG